MKMAKTTNWPKVRLEEVCEHITVGHVGPMVNEYQEDGVPFLRSQNVRPYRFDPSDLKFISRDFHARLRKSALKPNDVVVTRSGANTGQCCIIPPRLAEANCADLVIFRPSDRLNPWFLMYLLNSDWGRATIAGGVVGAAQHHFNIGIAKRLTVQLPPLFIQRRIAAILSAYDMLIENNKQRIRILDAMSLSLYREWFVKLRFPDHEDMEMISSSLGPIPDGWKIVRVGDHFTTVLGGTPSRGKPEFWDGGDIPWINSGKVNELRVIEPSEFITGLGLSRSSAKLMPKRTTIIAITGATLGQVSLLEIACSANQSVVGIYDTARTYSEYLYLVFKNIIEAVIKHASGGAQQHINREIVNDVKIALPPPSVMIRFNDAIVPVFNLISNLLFASCALQRARNLLLPKLMSGEIDVQRVETEAVNLLS